LGVSIIRNFKSHRRAGCRLEIRQDRRSTQGHGGGCFVLADLNCWYRTAWRNFRQGDFVNLGFMW
jgi:hypothetical protein